MNKAEFLYVLERELSDISPDERQEAVIYYKQYFEDAGRENEQTILQELGNPVLVGREIKANCASTQNYYSQMQGAYNNAGYNQNTQYKNTQNNNYGNQTNYSQSERPKRDNSIKFVIIVILVLTFPIWIGVIGGLVGSFFGIVGGIIGIFFGLIGSIIGVFFGLIGNVIGVGAGIALGAPIGVLFLGVSLVALSVLVLMLIFLIWVIKKIVYLIISLFKNK